MLLTESNEVATTPQPKRRRTLGSGVVSAQRVEVSPPSVGTNSRVDLAIKEEIEKFQIISSKILAQGAANSFYEGTDRFNLRKFWTDHKTVLPIHSRVYIAHVGCLKAAAANVETVFSGAGKFTQAATSVSATFLGCAALTFSCYRVAVACDRPCMLALFVQYAHAQPMTACNEKNATSLAFRS